MGGEGSMVMCNEWSGDKAKILNDLGRPEMHCNSSKMCRDPDHSHIHTAAKFRE